jgi:hypothetical protein
MAQAVQGLRVALGAMASPFVRFGNAYAAAAERRPFEVGVLTTGIKTSAADLFAQMVCFYLMESPVLSFTNPNFE